MANTDALSLLGGGQPVDTDQLRAAAEQTIGKIRDLDGQAMSLLQDNPTLGPDVEQIRASIRRMIVKVGQTLPPQTNSQNALPMGG